MGKLNQLTRCILLNIVLLVILNSEPCTGIKCWVCNSAIDPGCRDPFDNSSYAITDCEHWHHLSDSKAKATHCRKSYYKANGTWYYVRDCAIISETPIPNGASELAFCTGKNINYDQDCFCRDKDGCNEAGQIVPMFGVVVSGVLMGILTMIVLKI